jgi:heme-degrading monooxygenase HmoA
MAFLTEFNGTNSGHYKTAAKVLIVSVWEKQRKSQAWHIVGSDYGA